MDSELLMKHTLSSIFLLPLLILLTGENVFCQPDSSEILIAEPGRRPIIQLDSLEFIHVTWWNSGIYHSIYDTNGIQILPPHELSSSGSQFTDLAIGNAIGISVWEETAPDFDSHIWGQRIAINGDTVGNNFRINYPPSSDSYRYDANIVHTQNDSFFVVWFWQDQGIYGQIVTESPVTNNNFLISDHPIANIAFPSPKVSSRGNCPNTIVIWIDDRVDTPLLYGRKLLNTGEPQDSSFLISEVPGIVKVEKASLVMNSCETFTTAYIATLDDSTTNVYYRSLDVNGLPLTTSQSISQFPVGDMIDMAIDRNGQYIVEWEANTGDQVRISGQRFLSDGSLYGDNFWVSSNTFSNDLYAPSCILHNNTIYSSWYEENDSTSAVWMSIIDFNNPYTGANETNGGIPSQYKLYQNYPNPFNAKTTIDFLVRNNGLINLSVYEVTGRKVETLINKKMNVGNYSVVWDASNLSSGIYLVTMTSNAFIKTRKALLLK